MAVAHMGGGDVVGLRRGVRRAQHVEPRVVRGEEHLEHGGVEVRAALWPRRPGVCSGVSPSTVAMSPNCTSRSTSTTWPGWMRPRPTARLLATVVLPVPPLGDRTVITRVVSTGSVFARHGPAWPAAVPVSSVARWRAPSQGLVVGVGETTSRTPARRAPSQRAGRRLGEQHDAELGSLHGRRPRPCESASSGRRGRGRGRRPRRRARRRRRPPWWGRPAGTRPASAVAARPRVRARPRGDASKAVVGEMKTMGLIAAPPCRRTRCPG